MIDFTKHSFRKIILFRLFKDHTDRVVAVNIDLYLDAVLLLYFETIELKYFIWNPE